MESRPSTRRVETPKRNFLRSWPPSIRECAEALAVSVAYSSERIVDQSQRFRRGHFGPTTEPRPGLR